MLTNKLLPACCLLFSTFANASSTDNFLVITDIHLNLNSQHRMELYPKSSTHKNDLDRQTFQKLLKATQSSIQKNLISKPNFILILGDINAHRTTNKTRVANEAYVFNKLNQEFANTPIIYVTGNNDSPQRNYGRFTWHKQSPYTIATTKANWKNGFLNTGKLCKSSQEYPCITSQDSRNGYFSTLIMPKLLLIGLNSTLFAVENKFIHSAKDELNWLDQQLQTAKDNNEQVIIAMHIPPGYNIYDNSIFWRKKALQRFNNIIANSQNVIIGMLSSHTHNDELKIYTNKQSKIGIYATASLSTSHCNAPSVKSFYLAKTNKRWHINNFITYKFNLTNEQLTLQKLYDFKTEYCPKDTKDINLCLNNLELKKLQKFMNVGNPNCQTTINAPQNIFLQGE